MNSMKRAGLKLFSLCVLALGLVAFSASAAQAAGTWMVNKVDLTTTAQNKELVGKLDENHGILLAKLGLNEVEVLCTALELLNTKLEPAGAISEANKNAKADFSGCVTLINKKVAEKCVPVDGTTKGVILTEEWYALLTLHELKNAEGKLIGTDGVTVITPAVGTLLAIIHLGKGCAAGLELKVFGSLALSDVGVALNADELEVERANHLAAEFKPLTDLTVANEESKSKATLDGMADITLSGGGNWSGLK
jgi:hypothetical protein